MSAAMAIARRCPSVAPLLRVNNVTKSYGDTIGCRDVSFTLYPGEVIGIVGESGSGKSTLLNVLSAQLPPDAGLIEYRSRSTRA